MQAFAFLVILMAACMGALLTHAVAAESDPVIGSRTDKPDGSTALSIGRRLPTDWETKLGLDLQLAPPDDTLGGLDPLPNDPARRSTGTAWINMTLPGLVTPLGWDKTIVDARLDPDHGTSHVAAALARSVPLGDGLLLTLQDRLSLADTFEKDTADLPALGTTSAAADARVWDESPSLRLELPETGTAFGAGATVSSTDNQWHNQISAEQKLWGPLDALAVTTSVTDPGTGASSKSIGARFERKW
ncbi:MAG TPA: hypothetical protein VHA77_12325 [Xanthobacteraceae bacterium]|jgi:hypothetical protein|nr:hypothetical protein [Xanthobacteraceae bacterium]